MRLQRLARKLTVIAVTAALMCSSVMTTPVFADENVEEAPAGEEGVEGAEGA